MTRIVDTKQITVFQLRQLAELLVAAFREMAPNAWPTVEAAEAEVAESLEPDRIALVALDRRDTVVGWIGSIPGYEGRVWEVHPLAVRPDVQRSGIGRALVDRLEAEVRKRGGLTLWLGSDDTEGMTNLAGIDLYPDPLAKLAKIRSVRDHPFVFYQKLGFALAGVVPDANGFGKPDILLAKRVSLIGT